MNPVAPKQSLLLLVLSSLPLLLASARGGAAPVKEAPVHGGVSPDGRMEIVLSQPDERVARPMAVIRWRGGGVIGQVFVGAHVSFEEARLPANTEALWRPDCRMVALKARSGPQGTEVTVQQLRDGARLREQRLPDPFLRILPDYQAFDIWRTAVARPLRWTPEGNLVTYVYGDCVPWDNFRKGQAVIFEYEVTYEGESGSLLDVRKIRERTTSAR